MTVKAKVVLLFCGQGMATLVEVYLGGDFNAAPDHLVLVDFGGNTHQGEDEWGVPAADYVVDKLKQQQKTHGYSAFDYVIISHQDNDHWLLLPSLTEAIEKAEEASDLHRPSLFGIYAGGTMWGPRAKQAVQSFLATTFDVNYEDEFKFNAPYLSHYTAKTKRNALGRLARFPDVDASDTIYLRVLVSCLPISSGGPDLVKNGSSAVVVLENGTQAVVLPGDATWHTMGHINGMKNVWTKGLLPQVIGLEVPHHGALRTSVENYSKKRKRDDFDWTIITNFAAKMKPFLVGASAGPYSSHRHPVKEVLDILNPSRSKLVDHTYVAYVFDKDKWKGLSTKKEVHTTVQAIKPGLVYGNIEICLDPDIPVDRANAHRFVSFRPLGVIEPGPSAAAEEMVFAPPPERDETPPS
jgi:hypothetical protein